MMHRRVMNVSWMNIDDHATCIDPLFLVQVIFEALLYVMHFLDPKKVTDELPVQLNTSEKLRFIVQQIKSLTK